MTVVTERTRRVVEWVAGGVWEVRATVAGHTFHRCAFCGCSPYSEHEPGCVVVAAREEVASWVVEESEEELVAEIAEAALHLIPDLGNVIHEVQEDQE